MESRDNTPRPPRPQNTTAPRHPSTNPGPGAPLRKKAGSSGNKTGLILGIIGGTSRDVARQKWGYPWRIPSATEFQELIDNCDWIWTTQGGKKGYEVTGPSGNSIFLPAAGFCSSESLGFDGTNGLYWSSSPHENTYGAQNILFGNSHRMDWLNRSYGLSIRPVSE